MNWDTIQGNWKQLTGQAKQQWGKLTDDDLDQIEGNAEKMVGKLQERYGYARDEAQREALGPFANPDNKVGGGRVLNIFRTLARSPKALTGFLAWGNYVLSRRNSLAPREREMVILRTGWLCRSGYEFAQHTRIGKACGMTGEEIARITGFDTQGYQLSHDLYPTSFSPPVTQPPGETP